MDKYFVSPIWGPFCAVEGQAEHKTAEQKGYIEGATGINSSDKHHKTLLKRTQFIAIVQAVV